MKSPGLQAERLLAENKKISAKVLYFEMKISSLKLKKGWNEMRVEALLKDEKKQRKYKIE